MRGSDNQSIISNIAQAIIDVSKRTMGALSAFGNGIMTSGNVSNVDSSNNTNQNITIEADFSGVRSADEIERAFENMANMASQYANRKKGY